MCTSHAHTHTSYYNIAVSKRTGRTDREGKAMGKVAWRSARRLDPLPSPLWTVDARVQIRTRVWRRVERIERRTTATTGRPERMQLIPTRRDSLSLSRTTAMTTTPIASVINRRQPRLLRLPVLPPPHPSHRHNLRLASAFAIGLQSVLLTDGFGHNWTLLSAFTVVPPYTPSRASLFPNALYRGSYQI